MRCEFGSFINQSGVPSLSPSLMFPRQHTTQMKMKLELQAALWWQLVLLVLIQTSVVVAALQLLRPPVTSRGPDTQRKRSRGDSGELTLP